MYILVEFTDTKEIAVIPNNWLEGNSCAVWPSHIRMTSKLNAAVMEKMAVGKDWPAYPIKELWKNECYDSVRRKLQQAEYDSEICTTAYSSGSDEECRRSKRKKRPMYFSSDSENEEMPQKRKVAKTPESLPQPPHPLLFSSPSQRPREPQCPSSSPTPLQTSSAIKDTFQPQSPQGEVKRSSSAIRLGSPLIMPSQSQSIENPSTSVESYFCRGVNFLKKWFQKLTFAEVSKARDIRIFTMLEKLHQKQTNQEETLNKVLAVVQNLAKSSSVEFTDPLPEDLVLPVTSFEEVENLEAKLQEDAVFKALVNHLSVIGGSNKADATRRAMNHCFSHQMSLTYNWYGHKGKRAFGKLRLAGAIQKAVMNSYRCTASEVEQVAREWLRTAVDRQGGRKKRAEKQS